MVFHKSAQDSRHYELHRSSGSMKVLLINNHDSFVFNLAQLVEETGLCQLEVVSYDEVDARAVRPFDKFILSPGPGIPSDFPKLEQLVKIYYREKDILGVCLGHEAIALAFGGEIHHSGRVFHGFTKRSHITAPAHHIFRQVPDGFEAGLYHSWILKDETFPAELKVTARAEDGVIMALCHPQYNLVGFQYHPESIMTPHGRTMVTNWLAFNP
jgi:anthranilate synthase component 2